MGYLALAILIGVIIWTLWRLFSHKRLPLNYYSTLNNDDDSGQDPNADKVSKERDRTL